MGHVLVLLPEQEEEEEEAGPEKEEAGPDEQEAGPDEQEAGPEEQEAGPEKPLEDEDAGGGLKSIPISSSVYDQPDFPFLPRKRRSG